MNLFKKTAAGVEINSTEIKIIELTGTSKGPRLSAHASIKLPEGTVKDGKIIQSSIVKDSLIKLWSDNKLKNKEVIFGVSNQDVLVRFALFPKVPEEKLSNLIKFQAQEYLPIAIEEVEFDYLIVDEIVTENVPMLKVLLVAARKNMLNTFINVFSEAGLKVKDIDVSNLALLRLLPSGMENKNVIIVNILNAQTNILITNNGKPALSRNISLSLNNDDGDEINNETYSNERVEEIVNLLSSEIRSSVNYFRSQNDNSELTKLFMCGSQELIKKVVRYLKEEIEIDVEVLNPLDTLNISTVKTDLTDFKETDFAVCLSLAKRGLEE